MTYRAVALIGVAVTAVGALAVALSRWRYANPPDHQLIDLQGTFLVTFGTQLGVTALAFGLPLAIGGAALWLRARREAAVTDDPPPAPMPRAVVVSRRGTPRTPAPAPADPPPAPVPAGRP